ncbi:MAG: UvrD-helicase domain-containing protein [Pseudomonadales bacterium]|nr:UvrD-helicase domain-containing protein [Pseudomonadales bacterium]
MLEPLKKLNPEQTTAVIHENGPAVVLAGAGSGKTTVLTNRVAWLISKKNVSPYSILVVTFTNKAAKEIKERIQKLTGHLLPWSGTFHSFCAKILRIDGNQIGLHQNFVIYDSSDQISLLKKIYKEYNFDNDEFNIKAVHAAISNAKNELLSHTDYLNIANGSFQNHVARVYKIYQHELFKASAVDFDDLLSKTLQLLNESSEIKRKYQNMFDHVLVDEYQDTNKAQYELTKILSQPQNNIFVVGDFCQSIYAWRGADYKNMLQLKSSFPNIQEYRLEQNYRSNQTILDVATEIISKNTTHPILKLWTTKPAGNKITCFEANSGKSEALQVVKFVITHRKNYDYGNIAILYRTNAQSREFEEALIGGGVPYKLIGGTKFYDRKEVKDLIAYLRYSQNRADIVSYQRILKLGKKRFSNFMNWLKNNDKLLEPNNNVSSVLKKIVEETEYLDKFKRDSEENVARKENVEELINVASQFDDINQFLENISLIQDNEFADKNNTNGDEYSVNLMSLHSAKGLEFEVVLMVGMEDGLLPHSRSLMDNEQMEEERRLCYVGITRAKSHLYFTYSRNRFQYGANTSAMRSRFIEDIPNYLLKITSEPEKYNQYNQYNKSTNNFNKKTTTPKRRIVVDDDILEGVLNGDFDIDKLINS